MKDAGMTDSNDDIRPGAPRLRRVPRLPSSILVFAKRGEEWCEVRVPVSQIASFEKTVRDYTVLALSSGERIEVAAERDALYACVHQPVAAPDGVIDLRDWSGVKIPVEYEPGEKVSEAAFFVKKVNVAGRAFNLMAASKEPSVFVDRLSRVFNDESRPVLDLESEQDLTHMISSGEYNGEWIVPTVGFMRDIWRNPKWVYRRPDVGYVALPALPAGGVLSRISGDLGCVTDSRQPYLVVRPVYLEDLPKPKPLPVISR